HYRCVHIVSLGMNLGTVAKMLKCAGNDDIITIKANKGDDCVNFMFECPRKDSFLSYLFALTKLMNVDYEPLHIPEIRYDAIFYTGTANIVCRQNTIGDKTEEATVIEMVKPVSAKFGLSYLNSFTYATPLASQVTLSLCSKGPLMVEYKIAEMGHLRFYLAPKIKEEKKINGSSKEGGTII
ncbi:hypothetical protein M8C21_015976, partial [Ambrosia artemisiifolia]